MKTTIVRDFSSPDDYFLCRCNIEESSKAAGDREEPKPICSLELYTKGLHLRLPFYNATRWEKIRAALTRIVTAGPALTFEEFTNLFGSYINYQPDLSALAMLIDSGWRGGTLLTELLPEIARLALDLPNHIRQPIRLLRAGENGSLTLSQRQAASLLACAFFCTFPGGEERANYNRINFTKIFHKKTHRAVEKLKCVLHYFSEFVRTSRLAPKVGTISIIRQQFPAEAVLVWAELDAIPLSKLTALPTGKIEDQGPGMTQMDFANKFIGGGVLGHGAVQEEIRFLICPELLISCLVCEKVKRDEAILLIGADRDSDYEGYARTFRWKPRRWEEPEQRIKWRPKRGCPRRIS